MDVKIKTVISLFDGMSCGQIALDKLGIKPKYYASEIDKHAIKVTLDNYPDTIQLGDVRNISYKDGVLYTDNGNFDIGTVDLMMGGSPCQSFSFNGNMIGMTSQAKDIVTLDAYLDLKNRGFEFDGQSYLFWEYVRLLNEINPTYYLLENVRMVKRWKQLISDTLECDPIFINSKLVTPQSRPRLYWCNISNITQPDDISPIMRDIMDDDATLYSYWSDEQMRKWHNKEYNYVEMYKLTSPDGIAPCIRRGNT